MIPFTLRSLSFLIVARQEYLRDLLNFALTSYGAVDIREEDSGDAAIEYIDHTTPDVLITAVRVGRIDGIELTRFVRAREDDALSHMAVILFDHRPRMIDVENALDAGVDDFLRLPFSAEMLHRRLLRIVDARATEMALRANTDLALSSADDLALPTWLNGWPTPRDMAGEETDETPLLTPEEIRAILN